MEKVFPGDHDVAKPGDKMRRGLQRSVGGATGSEFRTDRWRRDCLGSAGGVAGAQRASSSH